VSERLSVANLLRYGGNEVAFMACVLMTVFSAHADFYEIYCDVEKSWRFSETQDDKWTTRDK
jgi:hypothetical protein